MLQQARQQKSVICHANARANPPVQVAIAFNTLLRNQNEQPSSSNRPRLSIDMAPRLLFRD